MDWVIRRVSRQHFINALVVSARRPVWPRCKVGGYQSVHHWTVFKLECRKLMLKPAFCGLKASTRVMRHKTCKPVRVAEITQISRPIKGMKARSSHRRRIPNVVQPGSSYQYVPVPADHAAQLASPVDHGQNMPPTSLQW